MRHLLLAVPVLLLPLSYSQAHEDHHHEHEEAASLGAHEHGAARLNAALDGKRLELEFISPAMNLVGFEHAPATPADEAKIAEARSQLEQPAALFGLPTAAGCSISEQHLHGELLGSAHAGYQRRDQDDDHQHEHSHAAAEAATAISRQATSSIAAIRGRSRRWISRACSNASPARRRFRYN